MAYSPEPSRSETRPIAVPAAKGPPTAKKGIYVDPRSIRRVLMDIKALWDKEGPGGHHTVSAPLYARLTAAIKQLQDAPKLEEALAARKSGKKELITRKSNAARVLQSLRKHRRGGRPRKRTHCRKCRAWCRSAREAHVHCAGKKRAPR